MFLFERVILDGDANVKQFVAENGLAVSSPEVDITESKTQLRISLYRITYSLTFSLRSAQSTSFVPTSVNA